MGVELLIIGIPYIALLLIPRLRDIYRGKNSNKEGKKVPMGFQSHEQCKLWPMIVTIVTGLRELFKDVSLDARAGLFGGFVSIGIAHWRPKAGNNFFLSFLNCGL